MSLLPRARLVLVGLLLLLPAVGRAETAEQEVERLSNEAISAYKAGKYDRAVALLTRAYAIRPLAPLLYNLARAHDKLGDVEKAYDSYKQYVESGEAEPKLAKRASERLTALEPEYRAKKEAQRPQPPPEPVPPVAAEPAKPAGPTPEEVAAKAEAERKAKRTRLLAIGGAGAGLGLAGIGAGIGLWASAKGKHDEFAASRDEAAKRSLRDGAQSLAIGSTVAYAVGGALLGAGAVVLILALRPAKAEKPPTVLLSPWLSPTGAGGVATWQF